MHKYERKRILFFINIYLKERKDKSMNIPKWPYAEKGEEMAVKKVLQSANWWRNAGTEVKHFENEFAKFHDCLGGVSVSNGTVAIEIALKALNIGKGDEVIVPAFTFYSTASAVLAVGAIPVVVDVEHDTFCIDHLQVESAITNKTKAIIPVHIAGNICDMERINRIAEKYSLHVIEDASHAHGATWRGRKIGSLGTCSTFSFQNAKLMTAGEGGIVLSNNEEFLRDAFLFSNCGRAEGDTDYQHVLIGTNARMSEVQGAILRIQLGRLNEQIKKREENYAYLEELFGDINGITLQKIENDVTCNPHYMIMFYYDKSQFNGISRNEFLAYLRNIGIPANKSYESIHRLPVFKKLNGNAWRLVGTKDSNGNIHCKNSEYISDNVVCLNHNILLGDKDLIKNIAECIKKFNHIM